MYLSSIYILQAKIEITVVEGDQAASVVSLVERIGASTLIIGLHDQSFVYRQVTLKPKSLLCCLVKYAHMYRRFKQKVLLMPA